MSVTSKHVVGKHGEEGTWLAIHNGAPGWVQSIFLAAKFEQNDAVLTVELLKEQGTKAYTEPVFSVLERLKARYAEEEAAERARVAAEGKEEQETGNEEGGKA